MMELLDQPEFFRSFSDFNTSVTILFGVQGGNKTAEPYSVYMLKG